MAAFWFYRNLYMLCQLLFVHSITLIAFLISDLPVLFQAPAQMAITLATSQDNIYSHFTFTLLPHKMSFHMYERQEGLVSVMQ